MKSTQTVQIFTPLCSDKKMNIPCKQQIVALKVHLL